MRKTSTMNNNAAAAESSVPAKRTASGRAIRTNTTRPANYYARPFGSLSAAPGANAVDSDAQDAAQPGFFPALQYFSDAITALPKEVMRQFTLMKEVEAKIHGPNEKLGEMVDALLELPVPSRKSVQGHQVGGGGQHGLLSLTASNSAMGSTAASLVNGVSGRQHSAQNSISGSVVGEEAAVQSEAEEELLARRKQYLDLRIFTHNLLPNLDEKNVVLAEANRVLALQLSRVDSVMPHVDSELSEEARWGSMTHWAYSDNRQKKAVPAPAAPNRRDVAATNSLAAAANAIHETEIAQARREAGREAVREKHGGKGKRQQQQEQVDSDFDDKPKKTQHKVAGKSKAAAAAQSSGTGLGISTNGDPVVKKRRVDKGLGLGGAPAMERTLSSTTKAASKASRETPRSTPAAAEPPSKKTTTTAKAKPAPPSQPKKRIPAASSAQNSPALASSPLHSAFFNNAASMEPPASARPQSARLRQNSSATNLRHERLVGEDGRPGSAAGKVHGNGNGNGEKANGKRKAAHTPREAREEQEETAEERLATKTTERFGEMKREDTDMLDVTTTATAAPAPAPAPVPSRSASRKAAGGQASLAGTPRARSGQENFPPLAADASAASVGRVRSTRSLRNRGEGGGGRDSSSSEPAQLQLQQGTSGVKKHKHNRNMSSHLVKQLAPFNRSPDLDRHRGDEEEGEDGGAGSGDGGVVGEEGGRVERGRRSRPVSRRSTLLGRGGSLPAAAAAAGVRGDEGEGEGGVRQRLDDGHEDAGNAILDAPALLPTTNAPSRASPALEAAEALPPSLSASPSPTAAAAPSPQPSLPGHQPSSSPAPSSPAPCSPSSPNPNPNPNADPSSPNAANASASASPPPLNPDALDADAEAEEEDSDHDPDDPNEPKYCYCDRGSYGEMVACDNEKCPREWFHLGCTGLREAPGERESWYCRVCRPVPVGGRKSRGGGGGKVGRVSGVGGRG